GGVVGVRHEDPVKEALEPRRVGVAVLAVVMGGVMTVRILVILAVIMIRVIMRGRSALLLVLSVRMGVAVLGHSSARSSWWWAGTCPLAAECSAWKIASDTSWEACSFSSR